MTRIHNYEVKNIAKCNLIHDIINPPKRDNQLSSHYSDILHGCIHTRRGKAKFKIFRIIFDSGYSPTIVIRRLVNNLGLEKDAPMQWNKQAGNIKTNIKVKTYFTLPALNANNVVTWDCHVYDSAKGRHNMILVQDILT